MNRQAVAAIIVVAILLVLTLGYFVGAFPNKTNSQTIATSNTSTQVVTEGIMQCTVSRYAVTEVEFTSSGTVSTGSSTEVTTLLTYLTTTTALQTAGYTTAFTTSYSTYTGVFALANITSCQYING